jgi:hypothetical protein
MTSPVSIRRELSRGRLKRHYGNVGVIDFLSDLIMRPFGRSAGLHGTTKSRNFQALS